MSGTADAYDCRVSVRVDRVLQAYRAFNARDAEGALAVKTDDVDWPNAWEGGRVVGREAVRDYWERQWAEIHSTVTPVKADERDDGRMAVEVHQVVHSAAGEQLSDGLVLHVFEFDGELVSRMDVEEPANAA
jgi:ketosteroid isomerase-like protein